MGNGRAPGSTEVDLDFGCIGAGLEPRSVGTWAYRPGLGLGSVGAGLVTGALGACMELRSIGADLALLKSVAWGPRDWSGVGVVLETPCIVASLEPGTMKTGLVPGFIGMQQVSGSTAESDYLLHCPLPCRWCCLGLGKEEVSNVGLTILYTFFTVYF
jgi:hypothetical protein